MTVTGALTGAKIGVTSAKAPETGVPIIIAENYGAYNTAAQGTVFFEMDDSETYDVIRLNDPSDKNVYLAAKVTLAYDGNGADSGDVPQARTVIHGSTVTVANAGTLKKAGHLFDHWSTMPEGRAVFAPGDRITLENDKTLRASWTAGHTVTWLNGDDSVLDRKEYRADEPKPTTEKTPVKAEDDLNTYVFEKWEENTDTDGNTIYRPEFRAVPKPVSTQEPTASPTVIPAPTPAAAAAAAPTETPTATPAPKAEPTAQTTAAVSPEPTQTPKPVPKTGDNENVLLWSCLMTLCAGILAVTMFLTPSGKRRK